jgi:hypothetical protein
MVNKLKVAIDEIVKSSRHHKIIGDFGESLICNWLSRTGFEVARVDHTGIDLIAYNPILKKRMGITVKSRTRNIGKENDSVNILSCNKNKDDRKKLLNACIAFDCEPWIGIYVETTDYADIYLTSLKNFESKYGSTKKIKVQTWKMTLDFQTKYGKDKKVKHLRLDFHRKFWQWDIH